MLKSNILLRNDSCCLSCLDQTKIRDVSLNSISIVDIVFYGEDGVDGL